MLTGPRQSPLPEKPRCGPPGILFSFQRWQAGSHQAELPVEEFTEKLFMATSSSGSETVTRVKVGGVRKWSMVHCTEEKEGAVRAATAYISCLNRRLGGILYLMLIVLIHLLICCMCVRRHTHTHYRVRVEVRKQLVNLCSPFYLVGPWDWIQPARFSIKHLYTLSHLLGPIPNILKSNREWEQKRKISSMCFETRVSRSLDWS